jgi:hypothetical protein
VFTPGSVYSLSGASTRGDGLLHGSGLKSETAREYLDSSRWVAARGREAARSPSVTNDVVFGRNGISR